MTKKLLLICEEEGCSEGTFNKIAELNSKEKISGIYYLKVIKHPPLKWCEHGGADTEAEEKILDLENRRKREKWIAHEEKIHGKAAKKVVDKLKDIVPADVRIKFIQEEIDFADSILNEINESGYNMVVMPEKIWDKIHGKKIAPEIKIFTTPSVAIGLD